MKLLANIYFLFLTITLISSFQTNAQDKNYEEWYLKTKDSLDIYIRELGNGKDTIIVVHGGFGANHTYMLDAIKGLENKYHFVLYDQRGSLLSPATASKLTFQKNVSDLHQIVTELKLKKAKIMCHSMGTLVCMEYLKQYPEEVSNLVLVGSVPAKADTIGGSSIFTDRYNKQVDFMMNRKEVKELKEKYELKNGDKSTQVGYYNYNSQLSDKEQTELWRINFASVNIYKMANWRLVKGGRGYYKQDATIMAETVNWTYDYRKILNKNGKVTIIMGDYDFLDFKAENHKEIISDYKDIDLVTIPNAGHNIWIDEPELFKTSLTQALDK